MINKSTRAYFCIALNLFLFWGCAESLPPRNDPETLFTVSIRTQYNIVNNTGVMDVYITLINRYEEVLQDVAAVEGTLIIDWLARPEDRGNIVPRRTARIELLQLSHARKFDITTRRLTIDPGDSITLRYGWDFKTDDSTNLYNQFKYQLDRSCTVFINNSQKLGYRRVSGREPFQISAQVKLFGRSAMSYSVPVLLTMCTVYPHFGEATDCPKVDPDNPCSIIQ